MKPEKNWCVWTEWTYPKGKKLLKQATFYPIAGYSAKTFAVDYCKFVGGMMLPEGRIPRTKSHEA